MKRKDQYGESPYQEELSRPVTESDCDTAKWEATGSEISVRRLTNPFQLKYIELARPKRILELTGHAEDNRKAMTRQIE
jgi:hypothetical protein